MYRLYIGNKNYSSWSLRPWILMRALDIPFEECLLPFSDGSNWERFRQFSPTGLVPCLHDGDTVVWESLAIVEYLAERHAGVWPADTAARAWARSAAAEMHSGFATLRSRCPMNCGVRVELAEIGAALSADVARVDELWRDGLARFGGGYLAGAAFTAVDAFFAPVAFRMQTFDLELTETATNYCRRLLDHEHMRGWYAASVAETWRETGHEQALAAVGRVTADDRER
jgi:glutathione S-transferase